MNSLERPQRLLAIAAICISITSLLPLYFKILFVETSGNISLISPWISVLIILALFYKRHWARKASYIFCSIIAFELLLIIGIKEYDYKSIGLLFLLMLQIVTILILRDRQVKALFQDDNLQS